MVNYKWLQRMELTPLGRERLRSSHSIIRRKCGYFIGRPKKDVNLIKILLDKSSSITTFAEEFWFPKSN
jgi:hypothetical protein